MNAWKIVCATLVIFIAGIVTGATLVRVAQGPKARGSRPGMESRAQPNFPNSNSPNDPRSPNTPSLGGGPLGREFIQVLERQLDLSPEQRERIGKIMADGQERVRELRTRIDPEMRKELQQTREQIRSVLTPEQREQFEKLMKRPQRRNNERSDLPGQPEGRFRDQRGSQPPPQPPDL